MKTIEQLQEENAVLMAHVEALREAYDSYVETGFDEIIDDAFAATPRQHLAEVKIQAVREFVEFNSGRYTNEFDSYTQDALKTYENSIR